MVWHLVFRLGAQKGLLIKNVFKTYYFGPLKSRDICPWESRTLYILGNKKIRVGQKIRVGRVIGNQGRKLALFFLSLSAHSDQKQPNNFDEILLAKA